MTIMEKIKRCEYRHCNKVVIGNKKKKFCCDNCRKMEFIYVKRGNDSLKKEKNVYKDLIKEAEMNKDSNLLDLYKLIYR